MSSCLRLLPFAVLIGCAHSLAPAPEARRVPGHGEAAVAADGGVEIIARADAWRGFPPDLEGAVTPLLVTLTNRSERALELRYEYFRLVSPGGVHYAAVPPFQIDDIVYAPVDTMYPPLGFGVAPYLSPWYPGWSVWSGPFPYRGAYYDNYQTAFQRVALPSGDMVQKALPEGVLSPGGRITGYLYFEHVEDTRRVDFVTRLVDAGTGEDFGAVEIPFVVD
ncbi:hypothetical protein SAMN02745121_02414 [Nannocystis exedens]|uniref:Uncharacterized protein n=1 Tax=Nannocystis exedens TaxID=54 RepID=A0A1I1WJE1_9BACT|nr:hypothetical protein [Nannocystis exedens]PCC67778.1 hypothetical protein NAEX_00786 [Nannocystis exedens]SFD95192.1 hypothetical protein SAMN02745121_02414 [Nannocystis exedens]